MSQNSIHILPQNVANQIAAGEVVQRPSSVVKELLENAIDAGATKLDLHIFLAGKQNIILIDNGFGMSKEDANLCFERHATSKIKTTEDIFHITTNGFRGEALAAISAVSQVKLITKRKEDKHGICIENQGGKIIHTTEVPAEVGTEIQVQNLFYNVPARRNFLKSDAIEFRHILDEFHRVALSFPEVEMNLFHNQSKILTLANQNLAYRIKQIFGVKMEKSLVPIAEKTELIQVEGYIGKPLVAKKNRGEQFFLVNQRFIKSPYLHKAVTSAFENILPSGYHPSYFLHLTLDPSKIDINLHPSKTEIKFEDDFAVFSILRSAIKYALGQFHVAPSLDFEQIPEVTFFLEQDQETQQIKGFQWQNKYLVTPKNQHLVLINQHRAHQRIIFEELKQNLEKNSLSQRLAFPIEIELNALDLSIFEEIKPYLISLGFDFNLNETSLEISALPVEIKAENVPKIFEEIFSSRDEFENLDLQTHLLKNIAKASAIKNGTKLNDSEIIRIIRLLFELEDYTYSPFGKPIFTTLDLLDIQNKLS
ncbi:MAG: DNA mismatch repair protein MutL [Flavobacteriaceae bacterium]|nr:MAG: DNA mismatch repair protein MutL [Flavobacteriaceae bacterium]